MTWGWAASRNAGPGPGDVPGFAAVMAFMLGTDRLSQGTILTSQYITERQYRTGVGGVSDERPRIPKASGRKRPA